MNYRHAFHAGNHADVLKHIVLLALVDALKRKDTPFFVLDTHAGRGRYLLGGAESRKTSEADEGVFRLLDAPRLPALTEAYLRLRQDPLVMRFMGEVLSETALRSVFASRCADPGVFV